MRHRLRGPRSALPFALLMLAGPASADVPAPAAEAPQPVSFHCDAVTYDGTLPKAVDDALVPAHTMDAVVAILTQNRIKFTRQRDTYTFPALPPAMVRDIYALPTGEPFIIPGSERGLICVLIPGAGSI